MSQLVSLVELRAALGPLFPTINNIDAAALSRLLSMAESTAKNITNRDWTLKETEYTEYLSGDGSQILTLSKYPVTSIVNLWHSQTAYWGQAPDAFPDKDLLESGVQYAAEVEGPSNICRNGIVYRINNTWFQASVNPYWQVTPRYENVGNVKVQYRWWSMVDDIGRDEVAVLQGAIIAGVAWLLHNLPYGLQGLVSSSLGAAAVSFMPMKRSGLMGMMRPLLAPIAIPCFG